MALAWCVILDGIWKQWVAMNSKYNFIKVVHRWQTVFEAHRNINLTDPILVRASIALSVWTSINEISDSEWILWQTCPVIEPHSTVESQHHHHGKLTIWNQGIKYRWTLCWTLCQSMNCCCRCTLYNVYIWERLLLIIGIRIWRCFVRIVTRFKCMTIHNCDNVEM